MASTHGLDMEHTNSYTSQEKLDPLLIGDTWYIF